MRRTRRRIWLIPVWRRLSLAQGYLVTALVAVLLRVWDADVDAGQATDECSQQKRCEPYKPHRWLFGCLSVGASREKCSVLEEKMGRKREERMQRAAATDVCRCTCAEETSTVFLRRIRRDALICHQDEVMIATDRTADRLDKASATSHRCTARSVYCIFPKGLDIDLGLMFTHALIPFRPISSPLHLLFLSLRCPNSAPIVLALRPFAGPGPTPRWSNKREFPPANS